MKIKCFKMKLLIIFILFGLGTAYIARPEICQKVGPVNRPDCWEKDNFDATKESCLHEKCIWCPHPSLYSDAWCVKPENHEPLVAEVCASYHFQCKTSNRCIPLAWKCDGADDCDDGSDEIQGCGLEPETEPETYPEPEPPRICTLKNRDCVFPFTYKNISYDQECAPSRNPLFDGWCIIDHDSQEWSYCVPCPEVPICRRTGEERPDCWPEDRFDATEEICLSEPGCVWCPNPVVATDPWCVRPPR